MKNGKYDRETHVISNLKSYNAKDSSDKQDLDTTPKSKSKSK